MILGTAADDTLVASSSGDVLIGLRGDDLLQSDLGDVTLFGNAGNDTLETHLADETDPFFEASQSSEQNGGTGNDYLSVQGGLYNYLLHSTQTGGTGADTLEARAENIVAIGGGGADLIRQTAWNFECVATGGTMLVDGGFGADTIEAELRGSDVNTGSAHISGGGGADQISLNGRIHGSDATILGGHGADTISVSLSTRDSGNVSIFADGGRGADHLDVDAIGDALGGADVHLMGGAGHDHIRTNPTASWVQVTLEGGSGADTLICTPNIAGYGGRADVLISGDGGHDHLITTITDEDLARLKGEDLKYAMSFYGGLGHDLIEVSIGRYVPDPFRPDNMFSANIIADGGNGNDTIRVSGGLDNLIDGGRGHDLLHGSEHADEIIGGFGVDTLHSGSGDDTLTGGTGPDTFVFLTTETGTRTITDWNRRQDRLDLDLTDLNGNGLLDELASTAQYELIGGQGHLTLAPENIIIFEHGPDTLEDLFLNPDIQLI